MIAIKAKYNTVVLIKVFVLAVVIQTICFAGLFCEEALAQEGASPNDEGEAAFVEYCDIAWPFAVYAEPDFAAPPMGAFAPQTVAVLERDGNGWALISTDDGACWAYIAENKRLLDRPVGLYDDKGGSKPVQTLSPQVVTIVAQDGDWLQIKTWLGDKWVHVGRKTVTISAAGDCTLGYDYRLGYHNSFMHEYERQNNDVTYFLRNVKSVFESSDLAIVNLEGALTEATGHAEKQFVFRGPKEFAKILSSAGVDAVTTANNHTFDYLQAGYDDTIRNVTEEGIAAFGNDYTALLDVNGVKIGLFGYSVWDASAHTKGRISAAIDGLRDSGADLVIAYYHWGVELANYPNAVQQTVGRFSIDSGCDLVLGSHPHVIQGIEEYGGKNIVYSMGNFCFGGNRNPNDKDSFIFLQTFTFEDDTLLPGNDIEIVPALISSEKGRNNFQPTVATGPDAERILERLRQYSANF